MTNFAQVLSAAAGERPDNPAVKLDDVVLSYALLDAAAAGDALKGSKLDDAVINAAADAAYKPSKPMDNTDFELSWRKQMTRVYVTRALEQLRARHQ